MYLLTYLDLCAQD